MAIVESEKIGVRKVDAPGANPFFLNGKLFKVVFLVPEYQHVVVHACSE